MIKTTEAGKEVKKVQVTVRVDLGPKPAKDDSPDSECQCKAVSVAIDGMTPDTVVKPGTTEEAEAGVEETYNSAPTAETLPAEEEIKEEKDTKN